MTRLSRAGPIAFLAILLLAIPPPAKAAVNAARAGIGGLDNGTIAGGDGTGEARIELFSVQLALVKQARDLAGTVLPDGTTVSPGQELYFVLYVDNPTSFAASDLRIADAIDELQFTYVPDSLEQTVVPSGSGDAAIWAGAWTPLTDALGAPDDEASIVDSGGPPGVDRATVGAEPSQANRPLDVPASSLRAVRFRVRVN